MLIIADVHLGKTTHFRKAGIPIPPQVLQADLVNLTSLLDSYSVKRVVFLGDLFHSQYNSEWAIFENWLSKFKYVSFDLVMGNHDIHAKSFLPKQLQVHDTHLDIDPFFLTHEPELPPIGSNKYNLSGHLHPAVGLKGVKGQSLKLPCFYFSEQQGVLPAFGRFTGTMKIKPKRTDKVFAIANEQVIPLV